MPDSLTALSGWGRGTSVRAALRLSENLEEVTREAVLTRGLGRAYGDAAQPAREGAIVAGSRLADRVLRFDRERGLLRAEAGLALDRMNRLTLPHGWYSPVVPGTQFVTLGGLVAADVHGKNHHVAGTIGEHVTALRLRVADGRMLEIDASNEAELFRATLGGMGLTGHVLEVELRLERVPSPWIVQEKLRFPALEPLVEELRRSSSAWPFTVAWVDCLSRGEGLGRGILIRGRWAAQHEAPAAPPAPGRRLTVPCDMPSWLLGRTAVRAFNALYFRLAGRSLRAQIVDPQGFFYPLDRLLEWNRLYGRRGFTQYQCVLPGDRAVHRRFFKVLADGGGASFLAVLKEFGPAGRGLLSFPMPGLTVSLDLPLRGDSTRRLVDALNRIVIEDGGRIYLAKDLLTRAADFRAMEPRLSAFDAIRRRWDPERRLGSALSARLFGDPP